MDILYYSNNCKHCQSLLAYLAKNRLIDKYNFLNIDRRTIDPYTQQVHILLDRGTKALLPPNVTRVPTLILVNQKQHAVVGEDIYAYLEPVVSKGQQLAVGDNGEPSGFVLASSSGGVNIVSETYTMYDASPEELLAKGTGTMRQMHNYASATREITNISTPNEDIAIDQSRTMTQRPVSTGHPAPQDNGMTVHSRNISDSAAKYNTYSLPQENGFFRAGQIVVPELQRPPAHRHEKISGDVTIESLQQKRNEELQHSMPSMAQQLNNAVIPDISDVRPPSSDFRSSHTTGSYQNGQPPSSFQPLVGGGGYFSGPTPNQQIQFVNTRQESQIDYGKSADWGSNPQLSRNSIDYMPKLNPEDAREMLFGKRPDREIKPVVLNAPYLVNI